MPALELHVVYIHRYHLNLTSDYFLFLFGIHSFFYSVELPQLSCKRRTSIIIKPPVGLACIQFQLFYYSTNIANKYFFASFFLSAF